MNVIGWRGTRAASTAHWLRRLEDELLAGAQRDLRADVQRLVGGLLDMQAPAALPAARRVAQQHLCGSAHPAGPVARLAPVGRARDLAELQPVAVALGGLPARQLADGERRLEPRPQRGVGLQAVGAPVQHHHRERPPGSRPSGSVAAAPRAPGRRSAAWRRAPAPARPARRRRCRGSAGRRRTAAGSGRS